MCSKTTKIWDHPKRGFCADKEMEIKIFQRTQHIASLLWFTAWWHNEPIENTVLVQRAGGTCCFNIDRQGYILLRRIQACRWLFINYKWWGREAKETERRERSSRGAVVALLVIFTSLCPRRPLARLIKVEMRAFVKEWCMHMCLVRWGSCSPQHQRQIQA